MIRGASEELGRWVVDTHIPIYIYTARGIHHERVLVIANWMNGGRMWSSRGGSAFTGFLSASFEAASFFCASSPALSQTFSHLSSRPPKPFSGRGIHSGFRLGITVGPALPCS